MTTLPPSESVTETTWPGAFSAFMSSVSFGGRVDDGNADRVLKSFERGAVGRDLRRRKRQDGKREVGERDADRVRIGLKLAQRGRDVGRSIGDDEAVGVGVERRLFGEELSDRDNGLFSGDGEPGSAVDRRSEKSLAV